jgi:hypothetical protein
MSFLRIPNEVQKAEVCDATMFERILRPVPKVKNHLPAFDPVTGVSVLICDCPIPFAPKTLVVSTFFNAEESVIIFEESANAALFALSLPQEANIEMTIKNSKLFMF